MARELDRKRPFGTVHHSEQSDGRAYEQDGVHFDISGKEWVGPPPEVEQQRAFEAAVEARVQEVLAQQQGKRK